MATTISPDPTAGPYLTRHLNRDWRVWAGTTFSRELAPLWAGVALSALLLMLTGPEVASLPAALASSYVVARIVGGEVFSLGLFEDGELVGGVRVRIHRRRRVADIAGVYLEPSHRTSGAAKELLAAAFDLANRELAGYGTVRAYAPATAASKHLAETYVGGRRGLKLNSHEYLQSRAALVGSERAPNRPELQHRIANALRSAQARQATAGDPVTRTATASLAADSLHPVGHISRERLEKVLHGALASTTASAKPQVIAGRAIGQLRADGLWGRRPRG